MNKKGKVFIRWGKAAAILGMAAVLILMFPVNFRAEEKSSSAGQSLYDALRAVYGNRSGSSSDSDSSSEKRDDTGEAKKEEKKENSSEEEITTDELMKRMETVPIGPTVTTAALEETYHADYKVYEEKLGSSYTIFSNVKNGGVTKRPVVIDVPTGVGTSMKKDGSDIPFVSKKTIAAEGTYVLDLFVSDTSDAMEPFSKRNYLRAKFRFRIQYNKGVGGVIGEDYSKEDDESEISATESSSEDNPLNLPEELLRNDTEETMLPEDMLPDDFVFEETDEDEEEKEKEEEKPEKPLEIDISSSYDSETGYYKNTLLNGDSFYSSLPNGSLTNEGVLIQEAEGLKYTAFRNGKEYEDFALGDYTSEEGSYTIYISKPGDSAFEKSYPDRIPAFRFRIISGAVYDIGIINAPENTKIRSARYNGLDIEDKMLLTDERLRLDGDGDYEITFEDEAGSREVYFTLDTEQPLFAVQTMPNEAAISYYSKDISRVVLNRGNTVVSDGGPVYSVKKTGNYTIYVYDKAGNMSYADFTVTYMLNTAAVIAIISVLLLIAGLTAYMIRIKRKVKVL